MTFKRPGRIRKALRVHLLHDKTLIGVEYRPIIDYGESFDQDTFASQDHIANARTIKKEMLKLKQWGGDLDRWICH
jgi:hypothetical protein